MLKKYYISTLTVIFFAVIITWSINGLAKQHSDLGHATSFLPVSASDIPKQILTRKGYIISYNKETKIPNWVVWHLTSEHVKRTVNRLGGNAWHEDDEVPFPKATIEDYRNSGWSRGHMCPAGDCKWDEQVMYESFLFTNCCPQHANLNSGIWNQIEISCRRWAEKYGDVYIVCGPVLYNQEHKTIGPNKVVIPEAFFKVVLCYIDGKPEGIGYICKNQKEDNKRNSYVNTIAEIERITGFTFFPYLPVESAKHAKGIVSPILFSQFQ